MRHDHLAVNGRMGFSFSEGWGRATTHLLFVFLLVLGLAGCSDSSSSDNSGSDPAPESVTGSAQKGPFKSSASVSGVKLATDGTTSGTSVTGSIDDSGAFELPNLSWVGPTRLTISGVFFDEFRKGYSDEVSGGSLGNAELHSVAMVPADANSNVNLFTHFVAARTLNLMAASTAFSDAREQARSDLAVIMGIDAAPNTLNLLHDAGGAAHEDDSANLLLFSAATLAAGIDQAGIDDIANDFADDGQINGGGQAAFSAIRQAARDNADLLSNARDNLLNIYGVTPPNDTDGERPAWAPALVSGPVAAFTPSGSLKIDESQSFDAADSIGDGLTYTWDFGDGGAGAGVQATHTFTTANDYTVTLTVTDSDSRTDTASQQLTITADGGPSVDPVAAFTSSGSLKAGEPRSFDASASAGDTLTYYWDFGDGDAGRGSRIAHVFDSDGSYTVALTVTDVDGVSDTTSETLTITAAPQPVATDGTINGNVIDLNNDPIEGVEVRLINALDLAGGDRDTTTDTDGNATLQNMPTGVEFVFTLSKTGYADRFVRTTIPAGATDAATFTATMTERAAAQTLNNAENGGTVVGTDGTAIVLPAGALVDTNGNPVSGDIEVALTPVDVSDVNARDAFPGSFAAADESGNTGLLLSFGVAEYHLSQGGERLQLAPGRQATLTVPVYIDQYSDGSPVQAGDSIPLWSLDETSGQWIQEGMGTVVADSNSPTGLGFEMVVGHLSWYNCDSFSRSYLPIPHCKVDVGSGLPPIDASESCFIIGRIAGDGPYSSVTTNISGDNTSALPIPSDIDYQLIAIARDGALRGSVTVNGVLGNSNDVDIVLSPVGDTGDVITLPYEDVGTLEPAAEDRYLFTGQTGQFIGVQAGLAVSGSPFSGTVSLTTKSGQAVDTVISSIGFSSSRSSAIVAKLPANGEYLIKVKASNEPGDYWLDVKEVPSVAIDENIEGTLHRGKSSLLRTFQGTAGTVIATTNTTSGSVIFNVSDLDGNIILRKSPSSGDSGRSLLLADGTYVLRMIARSSQPTSYKTAVAGVELPQPLSFDSAGRATVTGDMQVYGDYQYYSFTAAPGDGVFARLETDGTDGVQQAMVRLYTPNISHTALQQLTKDYSSYSNQDTLAGLSAAAVPPVLDNIGARVSGNSAGQTHLLAVHVEEAEPGRALGGYTLSFDRVKAGSTIVIDDDLSQCPTADGHSVRAAAYAIEAGGTINVCSGYYAEHLPINNRYQTGFTISGRNQAGVLLKNESGKLVVNNAYEELVQLESLTLIGAPFEGETDLARGVDLKNVTVNAAAGQSNADIGPLRLSDNAVVDGLDMNAGKIAIIAEGDNISIRNSTFTSSGGRIDWEGDNAMFENNIVVAHGDDVDGRPFIFSIEGTGAQVRDNAFTLTGDQNTKRHAITVANTGDPYTGGENASPTVVSGNIVTSSSGGLAVMDFDVTVEQNFVNLTDDDGGSAFTLSAPRNIRMGDVTDIVKALIRNNVFDGVSNHTGSANPTFAPVIIRTGTPYLFTDINIINNTFRVAPDSNHPDETGRYDRKILAVNVDLRYVGTPNEALSVRILNNIISGWQRDDVRVDDEFTKAIWIPESFTIEGNNNLFSNIDVRYTDGGSRTGGGDMSGGPMFINGLLEVDDVSPAVNNGQGPVVNGPPIPDVDYDGTSRPQNGNYDIGAHENEY